MKIQFLREHLTNKAGDVIEVADGIASYLIRMGAAVEVIESITADEKKEGSPVDSKRITHPDNKVTRPVKDTDGNDPVEKVKRPVKKEKKEFK